MSSLTASSRPTIQPAHISVHPPGPRSQALALELEALECQEVTYIASDFPIFWARAQASTIEDEDGNTYLDFTAAFAVASVGHCHPRVVKAVQDQAAVLLHGMGDVHPTRLKVELARRLSSVTPGNLGKPIFSCSGSEAVETARKTCMIASGRPGLIAFSGAYHGLTFGSLEATSRDDFRQPFGAQWAGHVKHLAYPYCYRCPFGKSFPSCHMHCVDALVARIDDPAFGLEAIGGVLLEPVQGRGGAVVPPPGYLSRLREICDARDLLLIFDEIYTGFGRVGDWFAADRFDVVPDIMAIGKAMGGGVPISACIGTPEVMDAWSRSTGEAIHTSTFLGNPLACAAALASIDVMESEDLPSRSHKRGRELKDMLEGLRRRHPSIGDVRGEGLMMGLELVVDRESREPASDLAIGLMKEALREGLLILPEGVHGNVIGINPPLVIEKEELELGVDIIDRCLTRIAR